MLLNVVKRPFKTRGEFYPVGSIINDPAGISLYKSKVRSGHIVLVDEHNLDDIAFHLLHKNGVDVKDEMVEALTQKKEYYEKVERLAAKHGVEMHGRHLEDVVAEIKAKQAESKPPSTEE